MYPVDKFQDWLTNKNLKERTVEEYVYYFHQFLPHNPFNQENVNKFLSKKGNRNGIARAFIGNLQKFLKMSYKELGLDQDARIEIAEVEIPRQTGHLKQRVVKPLTEGQILEIEKCFEDEKEKLQLLMSYYGGLRLGELFKIRISSFNWDEWKIDPTQLGECRVYGKGDKEGLALFPPELMKRIARYIRSRDFASIGSYIFLKDLESLDGVNLVNRTGLWQKKLKKAAAAAGIIKFDTTGKIIDDTNVHPHKLRHSWGYHLRNVKNMDIRDIQEVLRHSSITSTQIYTYADKSRLKQLLKD